MEYLKKYYSSFTPADYIRIAAITLVYYVAGKLGLSFAFVNPSATAIWAPTGIAIASFLLFGKKILPAIFIGAFITNLTTAGTILTSFGIAIGNTLEGFLGAWLINKYAKGVEAFESVKNIFNFTVICLLAPLVSASFGVAVLFLFGLTGLSDISSVWTTWWLGDVSGALIISPLIVLWAISKYPWRRSRIIEALTLLAVLLLVSRMVFLTNIHLTYIIIPILLWAAIRFGPREASTAVFFIAALATLTTLFGVGPFYKDGKGLGHALLFLQFYMATTSVMIMTVAALVYERRHDQLALEASEKRFKALIEKSSDAIALVTEHADIIYTGPSTQRLLGWKPEELIGKNAFELIHPDDHTGTLEALKKLLEKPNASVRAEYRLRTKTGSWIWMEGTGTNLIHDESVRAVVVNLRDISERKRDQEKLAQEKAEDEALLTSIGDGIIATDNEGKIIFVNKTFEEQIGWSEKEVVGKITEAILEMQDESGNKLTGSNRPINIALSTKKKVTTTHYLVRKDKSKFPATIVATPVILKGKIIGAIKVFHDVTAEKEIDEAKTEFVSLASHQLRTPLTAINWYIELLNKRGLTGLDTKQKEYVSAIYQASRRMVDLTNALLTVSRLELGKFALSIEVINLKQAIDKSLDDLTPLISEKKINVEKDYPSDINDYSIFYDAKFLNIIFQNILSNAVKYTPTNGKVVIKIAKLSRDKFEVSISDTGFGIPKEDQHKIFGKLYRGANAQSIDQYGTGLGLYTVKSILDKTGGSIKFKSEEKKGTTFLINLPLKPVKPKLKKLIN